MIATPIRVLTAVIRWPVRSQHISRQNALVAGTSLAARRRELLEVEEFLAARGSGRPAAGPGKASEETA